MATLLATAHTNAPQTPYYVSTQVSKGTKFHIPPSGTPHTLCSSWYVAATTEEVGTAS